MSDTYQFQDYSMDYSGVYHNQPLMNMLLFPPLENVNEIKALLESWDLVFLQQTCIGTLLIWVAIYNVF
jgi:hypothetical protein